MVIESILCASIEHVMDNDSTNPKDESDAGKDQ